MSTKPSRVLGLFHRVRSLSSQFPLIRGMASYAVIWPSSSIIQEYFERGQMERVNFQRAARFGTFGAFCMAPFFHGWLRLSSQFFVHKTLTTAIERAALEQVIYSPFAVTYFFFGMSAMEWKPYSSCVQEVREKFWPTYTTGLMYWPLVQTLNFYFISERNRMIFVSAASFVWTIYLSHVKSRTAVK